MKKKKDKIKDIFLTLSLCLCTVWEETLSVLVRLPVHLVQPIKLNQQNVIKKTKYQQTNKNGERVKRERMKRRIEWSPSLMAQFHL